MGPRDLTVDGYTPAQVGYHCWLLLKAGLAEGSDVTSTESAGPEAILTNLTWQGHEFLAAAKDETLWSRAMQVVKEKGGNVTMGVLTQLLTGLMRRAFGV